MRLLWAPLGEVHRQLQQLLACKPVCQKHLSQWKCCLLLVQVTAAICLHTSSAGTQDTSSTAVELAQSCHAYDQPALMLCDSQRCP